ncbi:Lar family restriction alleviation protein [Pseudomonas farsensis]|uniref:Lar family restriction alleviation protein n=1 Tax=Pseudomonas farsensis TaxID=2745492 RepID=A0ABU8QSA8_9PSED
MPTENRSINTDMVSEILPCPFCGQQDFLIERLDSDASVVICQGLTGPHEACLACGPVGVAQNEGEEQPGRDKAIEQWNARAEHHQAPVGEVVAFGEGLHEIAWAAGRMPKLGAKLYTRADPDEAERLRVVVDQQKNLIASLRAELVECRSIDASTAPAAPALSIPDGYCLMPRRLTAENGAKALLLGEFKLQVTRECPECLNLEEPIEGCEICDGEGEYAQHYMIPWDQIKFIYSEAVKGLALPSPAAVGASQMTFEYVHPDGERRSVSVSRAEVVEHMDSELFEKLTDTICQCEPIGETNVVDCRCDEVAEQFELVKP